MKKIIRLIVLLIICIELSTVYVEGQELEFDIIINGATAAIDILPIFPPIVSSASVEFLNEDPIPDLVYHWGNYVSHGYGNVGMMSFLGNRDGSFVLWKQDGLSYYPGVTRPIPWLGFPTPDNATVDINKDGSEDMVSWGESSINFKLKDQAGLVFSQQNLELGAVQILVVLPADMNLDGVFDLVVVVQKGISLTLLNQTIRNSAVNLWSIFR